MDTGIRAGRTPRLVVLAGLCAAASALLGGVADAQAASWSCRASAVSASLAGNPATEPLVANSGFTPCVSAAAGPQNVGAFPRVPAYAGRAPTPSAETPLAPAGGGAPAAAHRP